VSRYLALDWDQQLLHIVSGTVNGKNCTIQKAVVFQENKSPNPAEVDELGAILKARLKEAGIAGAPVLAIVPRDVVILKDLRIPTVPEHEEPAIVRFQTVKELTHREEDIVLDYTVVHGPSTASLGSDRRILAVVLRRELYEMYQRLCKAAGLTLAGITPRPFGLACALQRVAGSSPETPALPGGDSAVAMVLITGRWGEFSVFRGDVPVLTRTINVGGNLAGELRRNLAVYAGQNPQHPVKAIYLTGDVSEDAREALAGALPDLPLHTFDPFAGASRADIPATQRAGFTAAVGVLHARARKAGLPINFLEPRQPRKPADPRKGLLIAAAAALILLVGGGWLFATLQLQAKNNELQELQSEQTEYDGKLAFVKTQGKTLQALSDWDAPVWIDEIYDLTARIGDVDKLRITKLIAEPLVKTATSPYISRITIHGKLMEEGDTTPLKTLMDKFREDAAYSPEAPTMNGENFTMKVMVEKRDPKTLVRKLPVPVEKEKRP
jgi:Tfp pilus assembly PilM family ATPase